MQAGRLASRCTLQTPATAVDALGQPVPGWTDIAQVWADIRMKSGMEAIRADAPVSTVQASVRIRYRSNISAGMRLVHGSTHYEIKAVLPDVGGREYLDLACEVSQ